MSTFIQEFVHHLQRWNVAVEQLLRKSEDAYHSVGLIDRMFADAAINTAAYQLTPDERVTLHELCNSYRENQSYRIDDILQSINEMKHRAFEVTRDQLIVGEQDFIAELNAMQEKQNHLNTCLAEMDLLVSDLMAATTDTPLSRHNQTETVVAALETRTEVAGEFNDAITAGAELAAKLRNWIGPRQVHAMSVDAVMREVGPPAIVTTMESELSRLTAVLATEEAELSKEKSFVASLLQDMKALEGALETIRESRASALTKLQAQFDANRSTMECQADAAIAVADYSCKGLEDHRNELRRKMAVLRNTAQEEFDRNSLHERIRSVRDDHVRPAVRQLKADVELRDRRDTRMTYSDVDDVPTRHYLLTEEPRATQLRFLLGTNRSSSICLLPIREGHRPLICRSNEARFQVNEEWFEAVISCKVSD